MIRRAVFDTNTVVSALLFRTGRLAWLRAVWRDGQLTPIACRATVAELVRVLAYPKFRLSPSEREELLGDYLPYAELVDLDNLPRPQIPKCRDPHDEIFLHLAVAASAEAIVSGDRDVLTLAEAFPCPIITPAILRRRLEVDSQ